MVDDSFCTEPRPSDTAACNTHPCCSTDPLNMADRGCIGGTSDIIWWVQFHYGSDTGSAADRAACQADCTRHAGSRSEWCCELGEDSTTGRSWSCSVHTMVGTRSRSDPDIDGSYVGFGGCE
jgi:hypothetical protein